MTFQTSQMRLALFTALAGIGLYAAPFSQANDIAAPVLSQPDGQTTSLRIDYTGSISVLPIGKLTYSAQLGHDAYSIEAEMKTAGIAKLLKSNGLTSTTKGTYASNVMLPSEHIIQKNDKKNRRTEIKYDASGAPVDVSIVPPRGSMGEPPATAQEKAEATDTLSGVLKLMMTGYGFGDQPCTGIIPMFDGKQRYNLRMESQGMTEVKTKVYSGEALRCHVYLEHVSGYDLDDALSEEERTTPLEATLVDHDKQGLWVPIRFEYRIGGIKLKIKAKKLSVKFS